MKAVVVYNLVHETDLVMRHYSQPHLVVPVDGQGFVERPHSLEGPAWHERRASPYEVVVRQDTKRTTSFVPDAHEQAVKVGILRHTGASDREFGIRTKTHVLS